MIATLGFIAAKSPVGLTLEIEDITAKKVKITVYKIIVGKKLLTILK
jgi:hypothetical protein